MILMTFSINKFKLGGVALLLLALNGTPLKADDTTPKTQSKAKKETKYDKFFKDKKYETAKSKFITVHKMDNKIYLELPCKFLKQQMMLGGTIASTTDPTTVTVGSKNFNPILFYFDIQDSSVVMKTPNNVLFRDNTQPEDLQGALALNYGDAVWQGFNILAYNNDSTAVVFDVTSLLGKPNNLLPIMPTKNGNYNIKATPKSELSFIRSIKSFDTNVSINNDFTYGISSSLMSMPIGGERPTTVGVNYSLALIPQSMVRPRIMDSRIGVNYSMRLGIPIEGNSTKRVFFAHRWGLIPKDKKTYAKGKLVEPVSPIRFYLDNSFPETWREPIREGILEWNKAFEKIGFKDAIQVIDFPNNDKNFDADNIQYSCIRYIPNGSSAAPTSDVRINPNTGEIMNASLFVYSNIEKLLHKWRFVETGAVDTNVRNNKLSEKLFAEGLKMIIVKEAGHMLGLVDNPGSASVYPTDSLLNGRFTNTMGLSPSVMNSIHYNFIAQPNNQRAALVQTKLGAYDYFTIDWLYRYFDTAQITINEEKNKLQQFVDTKVTNPRLRFYAEKNVRWDPRVQAGLLGNDLIKGAELANKNLNVVEKNLSQWIKNDEDTRIKDQLYLQIAQNRYAFFKQVMSNVGGMYLNDMKISSRVPRYQVVPKDLQKMSLQWALNQALNFTKYANRNYEQKGFMSVSYYDQTLEFIAYDLLAARSRVAITGYLDSNSYSQKEYFDDVYTAIFKSVQEQRKPSQEERILQRTFINYAQNVVSKATGSSVGGGAASSQRTAIAAGEEGATPGFGDPSQSIAPSVDLTLADNSELYFYNSLLKLRPSLEKCLKANLPLEARTHYEMLLFKLNKAMEVKK